MNWNNAAEQLVAGSLGMAPEAGAILAALVYIFWPEDDNAVWDQIENQVEALIDQEIDTLVYSQVSDSLTGLQQLVNDYTDALGTQDPGDITSYWRAADAAFDLQGPSFQQPGYELLLLPLFAGYANLNLALLRDGALTGASWGWDN